MAHNTIGTCIVRCLVLPLLDRSLTYRTQSATSDQGKYCGQRRCQTVDYVYVEVFDILRIGLESMCYFDPCPSKA